MRPDYKGTEMTMTEIDEIRANVRRISRIICELLTLTDSAIDRLNEGEAVPQWLEDDILSHANRLPAKQEADQ